ncbi:hypothetical protein EZV73_15680 [Acidaminobacter sp. JC074]|uniref:DUF5702 domain-containing protein n=1 Tax=Acidaminobacter sp. JC074 TaxID=2530199 RepID=UPI001F0F9937|nr:DUF5702 domain-containing protein [Acidaminobacter sp. JC074]MCH4889035.1 hypothetical protein [Acidaminobacter sp. JC074]
MNNKGVITVKVILMLSAVFLIFSLLIASMQKGFYRNNTHRNSKFACQSMLASYDTYLYVNYGLYGMKARERKGYLHHDLYKENEENPIFSQPLSDYAVIKKQISTYMNYRLPANYLEQVLNKLEVIEKAKASQDVMDKKYIVDIALSDLGKLFDRRADLSVKVNEIFFEVNDYSQTLDDIKFEFQTLSEIYDQADQNKKAEIENEISAILDEYNSIKESLEKYRDYNKELFKVLLKSSDQMISIRNLIEETRDFIRSDKKALDIIKDQLISSLEKSKDQLMESDTLSVSSEFESFMVETYPNIEKSWYGLLELPYHNEQVLDQILESSSLDLSDVIQGQVPNLDLELISMYRKVTQLEAKEENPESKAYYNKQKDQAGKAFNYESEGYVIDRQTAYEVEDTADFWSVSGLNPLIDSLKINEYIMSTFKTAAASSATDYDYFSKYERSSYFKRGEIEYILMGGKSEGLNISKAVGLVYGVRVVMNGIHVYTDKEKLLLSESIALGVAGWSGFGVPLVANVIRLGWSCGESGLDVHALMKGESVPFFKVYPSQWKLDLGIVYTPKKLPNYFNLIDFTYHDYLRLMLMTLKDETKLKRVVNLIDLNTYSEYGSFVMNERFNKVSIGAYGVAYE